MVTAPVLEVRLSKGRTLALAIALAVFLPAFTLWMIGGVSTPEAFELLQLANQNDRRCLLCGMEYGPYLTLTILVVAIVDLLFGAAAVVGLLRAFGPPTLSIASDGSGRYALPWRTRDFQIAPGSRIVVGRLGTRFDPPLETPQGPLSSINLRLSWADHSPDRLAARLADLNPRWSVSTR